jgi:hypothetical protein
MLTAMSTSEHADADKFHEEIGKIALSDAAPCVNLEALVVQNNGLTINHRPGMGRVTVATRDFDTLQEIVLREQPAVICQSNDFMEYLERFLELDEEIQVGIIDMFYQPLQSSMGKSLIEPAKILYMLGVIEDFNLIHQLLSIYATNAHQYQDNNSALPIFGSKIPHSCLPNVGYSSQTTDGCLEYKVIRPIQKGEVVSSSYLSDLFETPTPERREILLHTKSFYCNCDRCLGPDYCRFARCPSCNSMVPCQYKKDSMNPYWECSSCGDVGDNALRREGEFSVALQSVERTIQYKKNYNAQTEYSPAVLKEFVADCVSELSPTHHLTIKALRLLLNVCTARAYTRIKHLVIRGIAYDTDLRVCSLFRQSVLAGFQLVAACECVAEGCAGCTTSRVPVVGENETTKNNGNGSISFAHAPLHDRATPMRHILDNLLQIPAQYWPPSAVSIASRYIPLLESKFCPTEVEEYNTKIVLAWRDATCLECGTSWKNNHEISFRIE